MIDEKQNLGDIVNHGAHIWLVSLGNGDDYVRLTIGHCSDRSLQSTIDTIHNSRNLHANRHAIQSWSVQPCEYYCEFAPSAPCYSHVHSIVPCPAPHVRLQFFRS